MPERAGWWRRNVIDDAPPACASCGSPDIVYDPTDGWSCRTCHRTDADE